MCSHCFFAGTHKRAKIKRENMSGELRKQRMK